MHVKEQDSVNNKINSCDSSSQGMEAGRLGYWKFICCPD